MDLKRTKISNTILILSVVVILFHLFCLYYIAPKLLEIWQETNPELRDEVLKSLVANIPFIVTFFVGILSILIFPATFFIQNRGITKKKWLLVIVALLVYFLNLYLILAVVCLGIYLWKMWEEFQGFRNARERERNRI
jgi:TRAP-type uncharacterized transport system fused permease subunit